MLKNNEIFVDSDTVDMTRRESILFDGNVMIFQKSQTVRADQATYLQFEEQFRAQGNVALSSESATVTGESIFIDEKQKNFELLDAEYQFNFHTGRGKAESFSITDGNLLDLNSATFTTCEGDNPDWLFQASNINIDQEKGRGEAWNTVFKLGPVPVLYVPYITFPISDVRKSGLLFPELGNSSRYGAFYAQPIYFSLADNYDITLTPKYMSERGWQWDSNFRHLSAQSNTQLQLEYMKKDRRYLDLNERYLGYVQHRSGWGENWLLTTQWTELSDDAYISEFASDFHHQKDTYLNNFVQMTYQSSQFELNILSQDIVELGNHESSYHVPLQISADWLVAESDSGWSASLESSASLFQSDEKIENEVTRLHIVPKLEYQFYTPAFQFDSTLSYLATRYEKSFADNRESETIERGVTKFRALAGLNFEKLTTYFGESVRQTLEPKIQYVYVEPVQQEGIGLYDSQRLKEDYFALFRSNTYSSIDRIEPMDQATVGISTSIFSNNNTELFRFGIAQVHKFSNQNVDSGTNADQLSSKPALAIEMFGQLSKNWQFDGGVLYDRSQNMVDSAFITLDYWLGEDKNFQINHRYVQNIADVKINQTGVFGSYKLNDRWSIATSYHYDAEREESIDGLLGFEYRACCWSIQLAAQRQIILNLENTESNVFASPEYENGFRINFTLNGFGGDMTSKIANLFDSSIFAYRRPYLITK